MCITKFNDQSIKEQLQNFLPKSAAKLTPDVFEYVVNMLLAGTHDKPRTIRVQTGNFERHFYPDKETESNQNKLIESKKVLAGNIGYIKINNSLFNYDLIKEFDAALNPLFSTRAVILDLSETNCCGVTTAASLPRFCVPFRGDPDGAFCRSQCECSSTCCGFGASSPICVTEKLTFSMSAFFYKLRFI